MLLLVIDECARWIDSTSTRDVMNAVWNKFDSTKFIDSVEIFENFARTVVSNCTNYAGVFSLHNFRLTCPQVNSEVFREGQNLKSFWTLSQAG